MSPWGLVPQHLLSTLLQSLVPQGLQSVEQIEEVVQQATKVTAWPGWPQQT